MRAGLEILKRSIGKRLEKSVLHLWYFREERKAEIGEVSLAFTNGPTVFLGCAGSGEVLISKGKILSYRGPDLVSEAQDISEFVGELQVVEATGDQLMLQVEENVLIVKNLDDQLSLELNGAEFPVERLTLTK